MRRFISNKKSCTSSFGKTFLLKRNEQLYLKKHDEYKEQREYLIDAVRFHYKEFYIWVAFFFTIISGLFYLYCTKIDSYNLKIVVAMIGYVASFLFFCVCIVYGTYITRFGKQITIFEKTFESFDQNIIRYKNHFVHHGYVKLTTTNVIAVFSIALVCAWAVLFYIEQSILKTRNFTTGLEISELLMILVIIVLNLAMLWFVSKCIISSYTEYILSYTKSHSKSRRFRKLYKCLFIRRVKLTT